MTTQVQAKRRFKAVTAALGQAYPREADLILHTSLRRQDAATLERLLAEIAPQAILEIGSYCGVSTRWMLECVPDASVTCIDPWLPGGRVETEQVFDAMTAPYAARVSKIRGYFGSRNDETFTVKNQTSGQRTGCGREAAAVHVLDQRFDVVFVDADHRTTSSINAFMLAKELGDVLIYHDAKLDTHRAAFELIEREWPDEWSVQLFCDGEDGLAVLTRTAGRRP